MNNSRSSKTKISSLSYNDAVLENPLDIAEAFNEYFSNKAPKLNNDLPLSDANPISYLQGDFPGSMVVPIVNENEVVTTINSLNNKRSHIHEVPVHILKRNAHLLAHPITVIFNQSIRTDRFPSLLKHAKITPLHKYGSVSDKSNFRPIFNLLILSKIFENLMKDSLLRYLNQKKKISLQTSLVLEKVSVLLML